MAATTLIARVARSEAERTVYSGLDLIAGVAQAMDGRKAADTADNARALADMLEAGIARLTSARRLFLDRTERR
ncbi:hypothetical protein [Methylobacterium sp. E-046]|uniref:hypothetical protein n=1 Tax=Methylobacterium sp. E-046 TaxID=2836576 RepID=UPI001FB8AFAA|nr:hypothetical protein [Methylobacterium sp. E-046]MCJ2098463.1 hypothetical protein [Methylobacterium sp. E-046]